MRRKRFLDFFGLSKTRQLNLVVSSYRNRADREPAVKDLLAQHWYYKTNNGDVDVLAGTRGHLTDLETARSAALSVYGLRAFSLDIDVVGDEAVSDTQGTIVALGSTTSNYVSRRILRSLPGDHPVKFTVDTLECWLDPAVYRPNATTDYGVLVRYRFGDGVGFVCAGIDEAGTVAVARYLFRKWSDLPKKKYFVGIFKCDRRSMSVIEDLSVKTFT